MRFGWGRAHGKWREAGKKRKGRRKRAGDGNGNGNGTGNGDEKSEKEREGNGEGPQPGRFMSPRGVVSFPVPHSRSSVLCAQREKMRRRRRRRGRGGAKQEEARNGAAKRREREKARKKNEMRNKQRKREARNELGSLGAMELADEQAMDGGVVLGRREGRKEKVRARGRQGPQSVIGVRCDVNRRRSRAGGRAAGIGFDPILPKPSKGREKKGERYAEPNDENGYPLCRARIETRTRTRMRTRTRTRTRRRRSIRMKARKRRRKSGRTGSVRSVLAPAFLLYAMPRPTIRSRDANERIEAH